MQKINELKIDISDIDAEYSSKMKTLNTKLQTYDSGSPEWNAIMLQGWKTLNEWTDRTIDATL